MAAKHILSLELPQVSNLNILSIKDTSQYAENLSVKCSELLILPPGFSIPYIIEVQPGFNLNLNTCALGMQANDCGHSLNNFPDGVYAIQYRVQPHAKVYVEYNFLRTNLIMQKYYDKLNDLDIHPCEPTSARRKIISEMGYIKTMIDAAKAKVEYGSSPNQGGELYQFAEKKLNKILNVSC